MLNSPGTAGATDVPHFSSLAEARRAAVDLETEARIQDGLAALSRGTGIERTIVIVAQRISSALGADEIVVLDGGRVVERGRHAELVALDERPRRIRDLAGGSAEAICSHRRPGCNPVATFDGATRPPLTHLDL